MLTKYRLAKRIGASVSHITDILNGREYASLKKAIKIEKETNGRYKVEQLVRPEVAEALEEYMKLRCPMFKTIGKEEPLVSK
ncbi:helix-turn-helix domain-containing protein [Hydrogenivirga sp.]